MPGRGYTPSTGYRYGFNGKENDQETVGTGGGTQDYGMRIYNPSLGKFLSVDPITRNYPHLSPFAFAENTPIQAIDLDGLEKIQYSDAFKNYGNKLILSLFTGSGLKRLVEGQFAKGNNKYDVYIVVTKLEGGVFRNPNQNNEIMEVGVVGRTTVLTADTEDYIELYTMVKGQGLDIGQTIKDGKTPIIIELSSDLNDTYSKELLGKKDRKLGWAALKIGVFVLFHEFFHTNKAVAGESKDPLGRDDHKELYKEDYIPSTMSDGSSPSYFDIQSEDSEAGKAKDKIEKTVDGLEKAVEDNK